MAIISHSESHDVIVLDVIGTEDLLLKHKTLPISRPPNPSLQLQLAGQSSGSPWLAPFAHTGFHVFPS